MTSLKIRKPINFDVGFSESVLSNQKVWEHDRSKTCGASETFSCIRCLRFKKLHPDMRDKEARGDSEWGHAERGNLIENEFVVPAFKDMFGDDALFMGENQKTLVKGFQSATPDGMVVDQARDALIEYGIEDIGPSLCFAPEIKTFGGDFAAPKRIKVADDKDPTKVHIRYEPKTRHRGQNIIQMGLFKDTTNYQPDYGIVLYFNPINLKDIRPAAVKYEQGVYELAHKRANKVFDTSIALKDLPAEGLLNTDCNYCDFTEACSDIEMSRFPGQVIATSKFQEETRVAIEAATRKLSAIRKKNKEGEAEAKEATKTLQDLLFDAGTTRASGEGWSTSVSQNGGRKSLDKDRIAEEFGIDLDDYMKDGNPYFVVRAKAED